MRATKMYIAKYRMQKKWIEKINLEMGFVPTLVLGDDYINFNKKIHNELKIKKP